MIPRKTLVHLYQKKRLSSSVIARKLKCSEHKVNYWILKFAIPKRSISDALYQKWNPKGDPFSIRRPTTVTTGILYGLGIGLYWGEGTKASKTSIKLSNTDPELIRIFINFLLTFYGIDRKRLRFGLQIFADMHADATLRYWTKTLHISRKQFYPKIIVTPYRGVGNYRTKTKHGVLTVYFNNRKLRDILFNTIEEQSMSNMPT